MAKKYIDAGRLKELLDAKYKEFTEKAKKDCPLQYQYMADGLDIAEQFIDSLQQEQPEFPTTDEEIEIFLATHPKVEVPPKYKTPDWLFKKLEQPEVDLEKEYQEFCKDYPFPWSSQYVNREYIDELCLSVARHFYGLAYKDGYEEAEEETFDRVNIWLKEHINDYLVHGRDIDLMFDDIKNAF